MNPFSDFSEQVLAHFSRASQDFTLAEDQTALTQAQQDYLLREVNLSSRKIFYGRQVHGNRIKVVTEKDLPVRDPIELADGFVTNAPGIALAVRTADCLPVFFFDPQKKSVGMVHAGWRGTQQGIVNEAIQVMAKAWGSVPSDLVAALGPCIRPCCYAVANNFQAIFPNETEERDGQMFLDLALANRNQLEAAGVQRQHIRDVKMCTCCNSTFFSFRRDKEKAGRHLSLIMLKK